MVYQKVAITFTRKIGFISETREILPRDQTDQYSTPKRSVQYTKQISTVHQTVQYSTYELH